VLSPKASRVSGSARVNVLWLRHYIKFKGESNTERESGGDVQRGGHD